MQLGAACGAQWCKSGLLLAGSGGACAGDRRNVRHCGHCWCSTALLAGLGRSGWLANEHPLPPSLPSLPAHAKTMFSEGVVQPGFPNLILRPGEEFHNQVGLNPTLEADWSVCDWYGCTAGLPDAAPSRCVRTLSQTVRGSSATLLFFLFWCRSSGASSRRLPPPRVDWSLQAARLRGARCPGSGDQVVAATHRLPLHHFFTPLDPPSCPHQ